VRPQLVLCPVVSCVVGHEVTWVGRTHLHVPTGDSTVIAEETDQVLVVGVAKKKKKKKKKRRRFNGT